MVADRTVPEMKTPMATTIGLRGGLWTIGFVGLLVMLPLAILAPLAGAFGFAALALLGCVFAAIVLSRRAAGLAAAQEKLSGEIGVLSQRLLKVEAVAAATARSELARTASGPQSAAAAPGAATLAAGIEEVTAEIGLLSGIVRELATVVAAQDCEIVRLKAEVSAASRAPRAAPSPEPVPAPASPPALEPKPAPERAAVPRPIPMAPVKAPASSPALAPEPAREPVREAALVEAFDGQGLEVWLQPVVTLPQRKVVSYEALARLKVGSEILAPEQFLPVLERYGRTTALDRRMIRRAATIARHLARRGSAATVAYGLSPLSLFEPDFLRSLASLVAGEADADSGANLAGRLAVTLPQASWRSLDPEQNAVLKALRGRVGFGLDRPGDLRFDAGMLAERGVSQIKVPAALLLRPPSREALPDIAVEDLVAALGRAGIRLVVTEVEAEAEVPDLIDLDVPLAQGPVFASPKAVRPEVFSETPSAAKEPTTPTPPKPEPEPPPQRRAFRDFLRRAV